MLPTILRRTVSGFGKTWLGGGVQFSSSQLGQVNKFCSDLRLKM